MFLEEVVIDGFKSYAKRTVVGRFDPSFNAITGLNGSGKSNILDAISFVLGISNLSQVRVGSLRDLVYKSGQAGVVKASVSLIFNNEDKATSPVGYERFDRLSITRTIALGDRSKYLINGTVATAARVGNLFHSVSLNVNNPHFLIMQGRITKVLNMKPPEILGMIEEAAGTRMFEAKKKAALVTISKKQSKVDEIAHVLAEDITPTLERLRKERTEYLEWSKGNAEVERLRRLTVACLYVDLETTATAAAKAAEAALQDVTRSHEEVQRAQQEAEAAAQLVEQLRGELSGAKSAQYDEAAAEEAKTGKAAAKISAQHDAAISAMSRASDASADAESQAMQSRAAVGTAQALQTEREQAVQVAQAAHNSAQALLDQAESMYTAALSGVGAAGSGTLQSQLLAAKRASADASSAAAAANLRMEHLEGQLQEVNDALASAGNAAREVATQTQAAAARVAEAQAALAQAEEQYSAAGEQTAKAASQRARRAARELQAQLEQEEAGLSARLQFEYSASSMPRGFDPASVKGLVARLIKLHDPQTSTALEVAAGGRLFQVVVDNEHTGTALLKHGKLQRRVTIIPLNKVRRGKLSSAQVSAAKDLSSGNAVPALELVGYAPEVEAAMEYVFGSTLVCRTADVAKAVTYDKRIRAPSVTLAGDMFDPAGTLEGGSAPAGGGSLLNRLARVAALQEQVAAAVAEARSADEQVAALRGAKSAWQSAHDELQAARHQAALLKESAGATQAGRLAVKADDLQAALEAQRALLADAQRAQAEADASIEELNAASADAAGAQRSATEQAEAKLADARKAEAAAADALKAAESAAEDAVADVASAQAEAEAATKALEAATDALTAAQAEVTQAAAQLGTAETAAAEAATVAGALRAELAAADNELRAASKQLADAQASVDKFERALKHAQATASKATSDEHKASTGLTKLIAEHAWVEADRPYFDKPGSDYDFQGMSAATTKAALKKAESRQAVLGKRINQRVLGMIESAEREHQDLMHKKKIVEQDKAKIEAVIAELDEKKVAVLEKTWDRVNRDFGSIFSMLLPGVQAKLDPPEGATSVLDGLAVRVAFGGVWKETLSELSGGQRSLLALSLILALLLFKPAPMYILDEVDAALDLSHTQNIGRMIAKHFSSSQFIVVSLKQGMFSNANVIFRTKFVDGVSTVMRTVTERGRLAAAGSGAAAAGVDSDEDDSALAVPGAAKRKARR